MDTASLIPKDNGSHNDPPNLGRGGVCRKLADSAIRLTVDVMEKGTHTLNEKVLVILPCDSNTFGGAGLLCVPVDKFTYMPVGLMLPYAVLKSEVKQIYALDEIKMLPPTDLPGISEYSSGALFTNE